MLTRLAIWWLSREMKRDAKSKYGYAWAWHCNIAVCAQDEGLEWEASQLAAARFMRLLFGVDTWPNEKKLTMTTCKPCGKDMERQSTHWEGCHEHHPECAAYREGFRAGMLRAAELATNMDSVEEYCAAILAEADK